MQFLWNLLPGAREARNDLIVGYVWLLAAGLWGGVPEIDQGSAGELAEAVGPVGVGVALSTVAFLLGSFSSDITRVALGLREARAFSTGWKDPAAVLRALDEREIAELDRLEGAIDRNTAEVSFRLSLIPPLFVAGAAVAINAHWWWALITLGVAIGLLLQSAIRRRMSTADIFASRNIRERAASLARSERVDKYSV
jgi:hypothetical protein